MSHDGTLYIFRKVSGRNFPSGGDFLGIIFGFSNACGFKTALERWSVTASGGRSGNGQKEFETEKLEAKKVITTKNAARGTAARKSSKEPRNTRNTRNAGRKMETERCKAGMGTESQKGGKDKLFGVSVTKTKAVLKRPRQERCQLCKLLVGQTEGHVEVQVSIDTY